MEKAGPSCVGVRDEETGKLAITEGAMLLDGVNECELRPVGATERPDGTIDTVPITVGAPDKNEGATLKEGVLGPFSKPVGATEPVARPVGVVDKLVE